LEGRRAPSVVVPTMDLTTTTTIALMPAMTAPTLAMTATMVAASTGAVKAGITTTTEDPHRALVVGR
jgi:hypothetical protein